MTPDERPTFLSLFSGIGGFDLGLERAGWRCAGQIEIDNFCRRVLERHWGGVPRWGDIRDVAFPHAAGEQLPEWASPLRVDLLCGGFPCQDLSVAGRRAGLAGARSGLFFEFVRLATELRPRWLLLENVPGLLSSNGGRDFAVVLAALGDAGYGVGWRVLDSRWFGVPQRRRRVFLVGHLGGPCPAAVLVEPEGVRGHPAPGGEAGADVAYSLGRGTDRFGEGPGPWSTNYVIDEGVAGTLGGGSGGRGWCSDVERMTFLPTTAFSCKDAGQDAGEEAPTLRAMGHDRSHANGGGQVAVAFNHIQDPVSSPSVGATLGEDGMAVAAVGRERLRGWVDAEDKVFAYQSDARRSTAQEHVYHKPAGTVDALTKGHEAKVLTPSAVRRLTPTECERLQSFPDGWTCLCGVEPYSTWGCRCPDGPRYAALGNAVTVNVVEWLGRRLLERL